MRDPDHEKQIKPNFFLLITRSATNANMAELMPMKRRVIMPNRSSNWRTILGSLIMCEALMSCHVAHFVLLGTACLNKPSIRPI